MKIFSLLLASLALIFSAVTASAIDFNGNGAGGFNGQIGNGILSVTVSGNNITFTESPSYNGAGNTFAGTGNALVLYFDTAAGGFTNTSTFMDNGDVERIAVSGYNLNNPNNGNTTTQTVATFPAGFGADYALAFDATNANLYQLASGGNNSLGFLQNTGQNATGNNGTVSITFPLASIGASVGQPFNFVGNLISETAFRSNEVIDGTTTVPAGNPGFNGGLTFSGFNVVPEPGAYACMAFGTMALLALGRRRTHRL